MGFFRSPMANVTFLSNVSLKLDASQHTSYGVLIFLQNQKGGKNGKSGYDSLAMSNIGVLVPHANNSWACLS